MSKREKSCVMAALALLAVCGCVSAARAESGRPTGPGSARPASPPPPAQKPSEPPQSQRPTESGQDAERERQRQADAEKRKELFQKYKQHKG